MTAGPLRCHQRTLLLTDMSSPPFCDRPSQATPLHAALYNKGAAAATLLLLLLRPDFAEARDVKGRLPIEIAVEEKTLTPEITAALLRANTLSLWAVVEFDDCAAAVADAVRRDPSLPYTSLDPQGRPAINLATGACKEAISDIVYFLGAGRSTSLNRVWHVAHASGNAQRCASCVR